MVYLKTWTQFESETINLYNQSPRKTRYVVKFVPKTGELVLKVTDSTTCLKYKTFSAIILNRFEALNLRLLSTMGNVRRRPVLTGSPTGGSSAATPAAVEGDDPMLGVGKSSTPASPKPQANTPQAAGKAGGKKKKKGKK